MTKEYDDEMEIRTKITTSLSRRCSNCYSQLPGYQVKAKGWNWLTSNIGPFCNECYEEIKPLLKDKNESKT